MEKTVYVVGIGAGEPRGMTLEARDVLKACDTIVGYSVYTELVRAWLPDKTYLTTPMRKERERVELCFAKAAEGKRVALVCSGDPGVYGMASLACEVGEGYPDCAVRVVSGVTAACSGAAMLGAPIGNDFCAISLSDALTPWGTIEKRLRAAAEADFCIVLYNPQSKTRPEHLRRAAAILAESMGEARVCGIAENIGREAPAARICTLGELKRTDVNMFTTVFIGNSATKEIRGHMVSVRGYRKALAGKKRVLLFGGTTEGRELAEALAAAEIPCVVSVATRYGRELLPKESECLEISVGRKNAEEMRALYENGGFFAVVDATHPYAAEVSREIRRSLEGQAGLPYFRLRRETDALPHNGSTEAKKENVGKEARTAEISADDETIIRCGSAEEAAALLTGKRDCGRVLSGNVLLTTGSKELSVFCRDSLLRKRLYARVLPLRESIEACEREGLAGGRIIAMQGPFSEEMNAALLRQYDIGVLVTKQSGQNGGYAAKLAAAKRLGVSVLVILPPAEESEAAYTKEEILRRLKEIGGREEEICLSLVGVGPGAEALLTEEAREALRGADCIFGAKSVLERLSRFQTGFFAVRDESYRPAEVVEKIRQNGYLRPAVVFSGDVGLYSGAREFYEWEKIGEYDKRGLRLSLRAYAGISSVTYFAAKLRVPLQEAGIVSLHGRSGELPKALFSAAHTRHTFVLASGQEDIGTLQSALKEAGLSETVRMTVGEGLSLDGEGGRAAGNHTQDAPILLYLENTKPQKRKLTCGREDDAFIRGSAPMTKEEIRALAIGKLKLCEDAVVYDVGSGTGSVAAECAALSPTLRVYAIEREKEALPVLYENCKSLNITVVATEAPEAFEGLPAPTNVFIGGSGGRLSEILAALEKKTKRCRVVITAVTTETLRELVRLTDRYGDSSLVELRATRLRVAGAHHLFRAENPVYVAAFTMDGEP